MVVKYVFKFENIEIGTSKPKVLYFAGSRFK